MSKGPGTSRRDVLALAAGAVVSGSMPAEAQSPGAGFPNRTVKVVVPYAAGGVVDLFARAVTDSLSARWKQPVIVENQPGADTQIATNNVLRADPDGSTILLSTPALLVSPALYPHVRWDAARDFAGVGMIGVSPNVFVVSPTLPTKDLGEFVAYARTRPGEIAAGSNAGASTFFNQEAFKHAAGIRLLTVPYKSAPQIAQDMLGGSVMAAFLPGIVAAPFTRTGQLRALAVVADSRIEMFSGIPTVSEAGYPTANLIPWFGMAAVRSTLPSIVAEINAAVNAALAQPDVRRRLDGIGAVPSEPMSTTEIDAFMARYGERLVKLVRDTNIKL